jgi:hypothetical protein
MNGMIHLSFVLSLWSKLPCASPALRPLPQFA